MLSEVVAELLKLYPTLDRLLSVLAQVGERDAEHTRQEVARHIASRIGFVLLADIMNVDRHEQIERRVSKRLGAADEHLHVLVEKLSRTLLCVEGADVTRRLSLIDLPYP